MRQASTEQLESPSDGRAEAVVFEARGRPIAGLYHGPAGAPRGCAIVLCNPFGYEAICAYRAYRALASRLSAEGFAVLRFDYDGTGDSIGDDLEPGRVAAWLASVSAALDFARARSGAETLGLWGMRLGALLASAVAAERGDVGLLALWAPVPSGRTVVREVRAFDLIQQGQRGEASKRRRDFGDEAAGFVLTPETVEGLAALDLRKLPRAPAPSVLVLPREDLPSGEDQIAEAFRQQGCEVSMPEAQGLGGLPLDPHESPLPLAVIDAATRWFASAQSPRHFAAEKVLRPLSLSGRGFVEKCFWFGPGDRLFGILTMPAEGRAAIAGRLLMNVGAVHHVGSNRMYVRMARSWAAAGVASLRFDLSGLGDSLASPGHPRNLLYREDAPDDVGAAMTALAERSGAKRFSLVGLCSGAYVAYFTAQLDPRVRAIVLINPQTYRWRQSDGLKIQTRASFRSNQFYKRAALRRETWKRLMRGEIHASAIFRTLLNRYWAATKKRLLELVGRDATEVAHALRGLSDRGTFTYFIFGADDGGIDALEEHLGTNARALRGRGNVRHDVIEGADHTFTPMWAQLELERRLTVWLQEAEAASRA